jgi:3-oxoacyl-[acyl-carrier protein] reductase
MHGESKSAQGHLIMSRSERVLDGKVAVVTGAGRGIGRAIALAYADAGASVVCSARSAAQIERTAATIASNGDRSNHFVADVSDMASAVALFAHAVRSFGGLDIVLASAGVPGETASVEASDPQSWRGTIEVNLVGGYNTARAAIPALRQSSAGKIVFLGSGMGHRGAPSRSAYCVSKAGLWMLTRILAQELAPHGICVNELVPGPVQTEFIRGREQALSTASGGGEWFKQPEDVAPLALFLASQPRDGPTGQTFSLARREL